MIYPLQNLEQQGEAEHFLEQPEKFLEPLQNSY